MSLFSSILKGNSFLGVDIGTTSIKIAEVLRSGNTLTLGNYGVLDIYSYLERFNEAFQTSSLKISEEVVGPMLKLLVQKAGFKTKEANASISAFSVFTTLAEVPAMTDSEIKKFIDLQAQQYIPLPLNTIALDWMKVGERVDESGLKKNQVLLVAVPKDLISKYQSIFAYAGLKLVSLEVEGISLARALTRGVSENQLIIDIGARSSAIAISNNGLLKSLGQTDFAGSSITQTISNGLNIHPRRSEDFKKERGLYGSSGEHELSTLITPVLDVILYEAKRLVSNFESNYGEKVSLAILSGGSSNLFGIESYFESKLGVKVVKADPFKDLNYDKILENVLKGMGVNLGVAIGAAIKAYV